MKALEREPWCRPGRILDLPTGTGRHAACAAQRGHIVTAADIDGSLVSGTVAMVASMGLRCDGVVLNAICPLPFRDGWFDAVVVVDFVHAALFAHIGRVVRRGGLLIHQSYSDQGHNWRQLLRPGETEAALHHEFDVFDREVRSVGPTGIEAETIRLVARRL